MEYEKKKFPKVFAQTQEHLETLRFLRGFAQEHLETHYISFFSNNFFGLIFTKLKKKALKSSFF